MATDPNSLGLLAFRNAYDINNLRRRTAIADPVAADADEAARNMAAAAMLSAGITLDIPFSCRCEQHSPCPSARARVRGTCEPREGCNESA